MKRLIYLLAGIIFIGCLAFLLLNRNKPEPVSFGHYNPDKDKPDSGAATTLDTGAIAETDKDTLSKELSETTDAVSGNSQGQHLIFNFTGEASNCLTALAKNSLNSWNSLGGCCYYSISRSSDVARTGRYSIRYELHITDDDVANSKRAETSRVTSDEPTLNERWYGASYYLPKDYVPDVCPELITQWQSLKGVSPPLALWTNNGIWQIVQFGTSHTDIGAYETEKWIDFVFHVKWSTGPDGLVEVWKQGVKVATIEGANSYSGYSTGNYLKTGIYKWGWKKGYPTNTSVRVVYIDDVKIGNESATYDDVAPGK